jgi:hypothetical protein
VGRFDIDEKTEREWAQKFRDAVQPNVDEEVLGGAAAVTLEADGETYKIAAGGIAGVRNPWADEVMKLLAG